MKKIHYLAFGCLTVVGAALSVALVPGKSELALIHPDVERMLVMIAPRADFAQARDEGFFGPEIGHGSNIYDLRFMIYDLRNERKQPSSKS